MNIHERGVMRQAMEALEMFCKHGAILRPIEVRDALRKALSAPQQAALVECSYGNGGYACCEGGPCQADVQNNAALVIKLLVHEEATPGFSA